MKHEDFVEQVSTHSDALRAAAVAAGPDAPVPTCPGWTVRQLVEHIGVVHGWVAQATTTPVDGPPPGRPTPPQDWADLLAWWDELRAELLRNLAEVRPCWMRFPMLAASTAGWARRQAHETAIHRLDAEHAAAAAPHQQASTVPTLVFDPEFAADGIDELLSLQPVLSKHWESWTDTGRVLVHAADAGRLWVVRLRPGQPPEVGETRDAVGEVDATVAGTADAVYRALWKRPSTALVSGQPAVAAALRGL
ncbi:maleylpyruvate isomerase N-terminal domain-containing protein [Goodfellowiella coeruleoviolacea]|uniref:TIGR03083 family protein n=1 Tax=Goodfellowiella coeruleoviolacea TaxID=334858 RepID=A0AAE3GEV3_9PSEU|nr:maleylpyruvate isomerase N-terminal domain-containing protein [Goodfellowiella coeruleoviolacea]MCP2166032.1 TIGR03083 family protein [Goodfellowiella coeruleoviolacea]